MFQTCAQALISSALKKRKQNLGGCTSQYSFVGLSIGQHLTAHTGEDQTFLPVPPFEIFHLLVNRRIINLPQLTLHVTPTQIKDPMPNYPFSKLGLIHTNRTIESAVL